MTMTNEAIFREFQNRIQLKRNNMPSADDCPWNKEQYDTYREGLLQGFMWAEEILSNIINNA